MDKLLTTPVDQEQAYRLIRGKLRRLVPKDVEHPEGYVTVLKGEWFIPTQSELRLYRDNFEGPINPKEAAKITQEESVEVLAARELEKTVPAIRDVIRDADQRMLEALQRAESKRTNGPRVKIVQMIERRLKVLVKAS